METLVKHYLIFLLKGGLQEFDVLNKIKNLVKPRTFLPVGRVESLLENHSAALSFYKI